MSYGQIHRLCGHDATTAYIDGRAQSPPAPALILQIYCYSSSD